VNDLKVWFLLLVLGFSFATHVTMLCFLWLPSLTNEEGKVIVYTNRYGEREGEIFMLMGILAVLLAACYIPIEEMKKNHEAIA
jgi:hypothetical protein